MKSEINKNYLWDKTESDAEIENLENLLQGFRLQESEAPILPQKIVNIQPQIRRKSFYKQFALAASLIFAVLLGIWFLYPNKNNVSNEIVKQNDVPKPLQSIPKEEIAVPEQINSVPKIVLSSKKPLNAVPKQFNATPKRFLADKKPLNYIAEQQKPKEKVKKDKAEIVLTKEEVEAYEKLKLALSITGEKLKIVKDKIDNTEENAVQINKKSDTQ
ncbi:MAG: hypothetical protein MUC29_05705 [Pyrinomonadaceae bacterium]|nr:hypothetical protein [Pyrinomonadaceae bacterium]